MAEIKSFPNNQDVYVGAEWVMKWLHGRTSGVFGAEKNLGTSIIPGTMSVEISDGVGWLSNENGDGVVFWNDNEQTNGRKLTLTHDVADGVLDRIDRVVVTWETTNYVALPTISILKGTPSSSPRPPALTNNNIHRQISLRQQRIPAGAISLSPALGTDERLDPDVCGIVTETVRVDTSTMQSQFEALLTAIQRELQNLNAGTAALLKTGDTMQGTLDMGGNKIQNVAAPKNESDAVNKKFVDDALANFESGLSMELLWKNASPTSEFPQQAITVAKLAEFEFCLLRHSSGFVLFRADNGVYSCSLLTSWNPSTNVEVFVRPFTAKSNNVIDFVNCYKGVAATNTVIDNGNLIPLEVYGIKGV